jgi:hypothetical protein
MNSFKHRSSEYEAELLITVTFGMSSEKVNILRER